MFDKFVALMFFFNSLDIDMRLVAQLKTCFTTKEQGTVAQVPIAKFKEAINTTFNHYRQLEDISTKICDCVEVDGQINGESQKVASGDKLNSMAEFMKCYPLKVNRDKNNSSGMNYVMHAEKDNEVSLAPLIHMNFCSNKAFLLQPIKRDSNKKIENPRPTLAIIQPQAEVDYVKHVTSMVLTRMEDKHRNQTEIFRYLDQRGKGKVNKKDFQTAIERMRISLSREDVTKVWNYIDSHQRGFIDLGDLSIAYGNRVSNFGKTLETAVEKRATDGYKLQVKDQTTEQPGPAIANSPSSGGVSKALKAQRDQYKINVGTRSPIMTKSLEHTYGANNLPSDDINAVIGNVFMKEAAM